MWRGLVPLPLPAGWPDTFPEWRCLISSTLVEEVPAVTIPGQVTVYSYQRGSRPAHGIRPTLAFGGSLRWNYPIESGSVLLMLRIEVDRCRIN